MGATGVGFSFRSSFEGTLEVAQIPDDFFERLEQRVRTGLLVPGRRSRANYRVTSASAEGLDFEAEDFLTAYAIGLNHVELRRVSEGIGYRVTFHRWKRYAMIHASVLALPFVIAYAIPAIRESIGVYRYGAWMYWGMVAFWYGAWPWFLTALHRPFVKKTLERILKDELTAVPRAAAS